MTYKPVIVVTGAIASGKSTVAGILASKGGELVNADRVAHKVLEINSVIDDICSKFGSLAIDSDRSVSRSRLAGVVFSSRRKMETLNEIVRPFVTDAINRRIKEASKTAPYIVLDAVLFFQYKFCFDAEMVIATEAPEEVRVERLVERDGMERTEALRLVQFQRYLYEDWKKADIILHTDCPFKEVERTSKKIIDDFLKSNT